MPNHIKNVLKFKNLKQRDINRLLEEITTTPVDKLFPIDSQIDFDKIIPEPRLESECPKDCIVNSSSHVEEDISRPWFDWYNWHCKYWGTKWNAYDTYNKIGKSYVIFVFNTAWTTPTRIIEQLAKKYQEYDFELKYADEDYGSNCGIVRHEAGDYDALSFWFESDASADPEKFAMRLWRNY